MYQAMNEIRVVHLDLATHHVCVVKLWRIQLMVSKYVEEGVFEVAESVVWIRLLWIRGR